MPIYFFSLSFFSNYNDRRHHNEGDNPFSSHHVYFDATMRDISFLLCLFDFDVTRRDSPPSLFHILLDITRWYSSCRFFDFNTMRFIHTPPPIPRQCLHHTHTIANIYWHTITSANANADQDTHTTIANANAHTHTHTFDSQPRNQGGPLPSAALNVRWRDLELPTTTFCDSVSHPPSIYPLFRASERRRALLNKILTYMLSMY